MNNTKRTGKTPANDKPQSRAIAHQVVPRQLQERRYSTSNSLFIASHMQAELVIARYDENVAWLNNIFGKIPVYIYNKGAPLALTNTDHSSVIALPNLGRESNSWLHHIITRYASLPDITVFLQGRIDDLGNNVYTTIEDYFPHAIQYGFSASAYGIFGPLQWQDIKFEADPKYVEAWNTGSLARSNLNLIDYATKYLGPLPLLTVTSMCGCFAVSRRAVHMRPISFYKELLASVSHHSNPVEGHYLERLWCYMFSSNSLLPIAMGWPESLIGKFI